AAGRPSSPTTKSTAAPSPAAATSSASNSSTASERRARHLSAVEGHHLLSAIAELREALGACCSPSLPTPSPCPYRKPRTGLFQSSAGCRRRRPWLLPAPRCQVIGSMNPAATRSAQSLAISSSRSARAIGVLEDVEARQGLSC